MASRHDDDGNGTGLWRAARALIFGGEREPTLRDTIEDAIDEADESDSEPGDLSSQERVMLRNLLHFGDRTAGEIAVTRGDIVAVPETITFDKLEATFAEAGHSVQGDMPVELAHAIAGFVDDS